MSQKALEILNSLYGYDSFRGHQAEIIETVSAGNNALVLMPTGGGKSLCYQIPSLVRDGVGVIITPLIALMQDQVRAADAVRERNERKAAPGASAPAAEPELPSFEGASQYTWGQGRHLGWQDDGHVRDFFRGDPGPDARARHPDLQDQRQNQSGQRDRQVVVAAFLRRVGGRQIDHQSFAG